MKKDDFGDRMKMYESQETARSFLPGLPVYARIDGRCFSVFTKCMRKPYDEAFSNVMMGVTQSLVEKTQARIGYTQSDEISLCWHCPDPKQSIFFDGKIQKMVSVLASLTTCLFVQRAMYLWPSEVRVLTPSFDCRVFQLPSQIECANAFLWREKDATKNAVSMATRCYYTAKEMHAKTSKEMQEMLWQKGVNFNEYPSFFKRGSFFRRELQPHSLTEEELNRIPVKNRPAVDALFNRATIVRLDMPPFTQVLNRIGVIFDGEDPNVVAE